MMQSQGYVPILYLAPMTSNESAIEMLGDYITQIGSADDHSELITWANPAT